MKSLTSPLIIAAFSLLGTGAALAATGQSAAPANTMQGIAACSSMGDAPGDWTKTYIEDQLKASGIRFTSIDTFADCFMVTVVTDDGSTVVQLYDPISSIRVR